MTTKNTTNYPRALLADAFGALHDSIPLTPSCLLHAAIGEAARQVQLARYALALGELQPGDLDAIRRRLVVADEFAEFLEFEADDVEAAPQPDALRKAVDLCSDEIGDDIGMALGRLEDARRARPDADPGPLLDQAVMEAHNAVTAAFRKLALALRGGAR